MAVTKRRAGELAAFPSVVTAPPRSSGAAATTAATSDVRKYFVAAVPRSIISFLPRIGFSPGRQTIPAHVNHINPWYNVNVNHLRDIVRAFLAAAASVPA